MTPQQTESPETTWTSTHQQPECAILHSSTQNSREEWPPHDHSLLCQGSSSGAAEGQGRVADNPGPSFRRLDFLHKMRAAIGCSKPPSGRMEVLTPWLWLFLTCIIVSSINGSDQSQRSLAVTEWGKDRKCPFPIKQVTTWRRQAETRNHEEACFMRERTLPVLSRHPWRSYSASWKESKFELVSQNEERNST